MRGKKVSKSAAVGASGSGSGTGRASKKRKYNDSSPDGMNNLFTQHLRKSIFGNGAVRFNAGQDAAPKLTEKAAKGCLFHSVNNEPLDVAGYNCTGYDSDIDDGGAEAKWRLRIADHNLADMADMCAVEIYFFNLWNQFVTLDVYSDDVAIRCHKGTKEPKLDKANYSVWIAFVKKYAAEIKRMKMEALLVMTVTHCWEQAILDAKGLQDIMRTFREYSKQDTAAKEKNRPHADYRMAHRLLRDTEVKEKGLTRSYEGFEGLGYHNNIEGDSVGNGTGNGNDGNGNGNREKKFMDMVERVLTSATKKWVEKEEETIKTNEDAQRMEEGAKENCKPVFQDMELTEDEVEKLKNFIANDDDTQQESQET